MNLFKSYNFFFLNFIFYVSLYSLFVNIKTNYTFKYLNSSMCFPYNMVYVPGDIYTLLFKENNNVTTHEVNYFFVDKYPVTNENYFNFIYLNKKWMPNEIISFFSNKDYLIMWLLNENFYLVLKDPIVNVSWYSSFAFCKYYKKRLPTLDEWEYIASATDLTPDSINNPFYTQKILNWYTNLIGKSEYTIKNMFSNYWNIFGLHSIIWEWVYDFNSIIITGATIEGTENEQLLFCGGATDNSINPIDYVGFMRFAFRNSLDSSFSITSLGFRCVKIPFFHDEIFFNYIK